MERVDVSIIVPVYNTDKYLVKCIDSLLNQTLLNIEILAVDDGSTDNSGSILDNYQERYPKKIVVIHKKNGGQASARNYALEIFRGEYVGFLDSDDFVKPEMFEKLYLEAKEKNADYVACGYTDITYIDNKEKVLKEYVASKPARETKELFFGALVSPFLHLYRGSILKETKIRFPEGVIYEDTAFYLNLIPYIKTISVIEKPLAVRLRRSNSTTTTFKKDRVANIFPVIKNSLKYYMDNGFYETYKEELEFFCLKILLCSSLQRISRVQRIHDALELGRMTLNFIYEEFPNYKKNFYIKKGKISKYLKSCNKFTIVIYILTFRLMNIFRRTYV